jgi:electron transfer flavoprotein alpha subunit
MLCRKVCNFSAIEKEDDKVKFLLDRCILCGSCVEVCPVNAIVIERKPVDKEQLSHFRDIWVVCEVYERNLRNVSYELVSKARELAGKYNEAVVAILVGYQIEGLTDSLIYQGADKVIVIDDEIFYNYTTDAYTIAISSLIATRKPSIVLFGATVNGRDLAPRVAARLGLGLTADCTGLSIDDEQQLVQTRPAFGGNIMAEILCLYTRPQMATVRPNVFKPCNWDKSRAVDIENVEIKINPVQVRTNILQRINEVTDGVSIEEADIVVSVGRGIDSEKNLDMPRALATLLDAVVGGSRPIVDSGWLPHTQQVGQSGRTVCPKLYLALGISGSVQHMAGMSSSDIIVAINKDPNAPIFQIADFGIVGDIFDIVPEIIDQLEHLIEN